MAQRHQIAPRFGIAHPVNATPYRAIVLLTVIGIAIPVTLLALHVSLADCINYVTQLTSYGFITSYFLVCLSLPFFLRRKKLLRSVDILFSAAALLILSVVLTLSVFPVPNVPWRYLPYLFLATVLLGTAISSFYMWRNRVSSNASASSPT